MLAAAVSGLATASAYAQSPVQPPAQRTPDPYASKVHVNLYASTGVPQELAGDSRGDAGSDLSATPDPFRATGHTVKSLRITGPGQTTETLSAARLRRGCKLHVDARRAVRLRFVVTLEDGSTVTGATSLRRPS